MSKKSIYKSQDELIGDWLDYLEKHQNSSYHRDKSDKENQEEVDERETTLFKKTMNTLKRRKLTGNPFLQFVKDNNLNLIELKVIISQYLGYLKGGSRHGETLLSILEDVVDDYRTAYLERKKIKERGVLFSSKALIKEEEIGLFKSNVNTFKLSPEILSILEGEEINVDEKKNSECRLFEVIEPKKSLTDIVLTKGAKRKVEIILKQIENHDLFFNEWGFDKKFEKGKGLIVMFYGPPGTGKTLTAEVIAYHLKLKLYIVSLSDVLNPYFGVTEKNIKRLFDKAASEECILLLDEVDSFISSRTKGGTYMDSMLNKDVSLFLRLLENYEGVAILTTNIPDVLDFALTRRISIKMEFPEPDVEMRKKLWKTLTPEGLPLSTDIDFNELAKNYELTGGEIKNAIMNAARSALLKDEPVVDQEDFISAVESEKVLEQERAGFV